MTTGNVGPFFCVGVCLLWELTLVLARRHHEAASLLSASWNDAYETLCVCGVACAKRSYDRAKMESGRATRSPSTLLSSSKSSSSVVNDGAGGEDERPGGVWSKQRRLSEQYKLSSQCNAPGDDAVVANTNLVNRITPPVVRFLSSLHRNDSSLRWCCARCL